MKGTVGKSIRRIAVILFAVASVFIAAACSAVPEGKDSVRVTLMPSEYYECALGTESSVIVPRGETVRFTVVPDPNYIITGADCDGVTLETSGNAVDVVVAEPRYSVRITLKCRHIAKMDDCIIYDGNGGTLADGSTQYFIPYELNGHLRPNTDIGTDKLTRDGYTLMGWNTAADGSGVRYGLGSRCDVTYGEAITLYAEWAEHTSAEKFEYAVVDGEDGARTVTITKFNTERSAGQDEIQCPPRRSDRNVFDEEFVCVPEYIDGMPVTRISKKAFSRTRIAQLILPKTITEIEGGAFRFGYVRDMWFFDNIEEISDESFRGGYIPRLHINAVLAPRFSKFDRHSNYADKVDILRKYRNEKKIVLFGGSGTYFSINSKSIYNAFGGEYKVINMGLNGWFSLTTQADIILQYLGEGDIFVHIPEMQSEMQLFSITDFAMEDNTTHGYDDRFFRAIESNYDMLTSVNFNRCAGALDSFSRFNKFRRNLDPVDYSDNPKFIDEYGDYNKPKPSIGEDKPITAEAGINVDFLTDDALARLSVLYDKVKEKGATPLVAYAAVNRQGLIALDEDNDKSGFPTDYKALATQFDSRLRGGITGAEVIGKITDAIYDGHYFFNSDWHMSDEGALINTNRLVANIKAAIGGAPPDEEVG